MEASDNFLSVIHEMSGEYQILSSRKISQNSNSNQSNDSPNK